MTLTIGVPSPGDLWDAAAGIADGFSFASDPFGYVAHKLQGAVVWLSETVMPSLLQATKPDLTLDWFLDAYKVSFGLAVLVWVLLLMWLALQTARGKASGADLVDGLTLRSGTFLLGSMFGPAVGWVIVELFHALSEGILALFGTSADKTLKQWVAMGQDDGTVEALGGGAIAIVILAALVLAMLLVAVMLIVAMVAMYLSGAVFPLAWVWLVDPARRQTASRMLWLWLGLNAAHPLLFLMLGIAFSMVGSSAVNVADDPGLATVAQALAAIVVLVLAAVSPALLFRFAPVLPTTAGQSAPAFSGGIGGGYGGSSTQRLADQQSWDYDSDTGGGYSAGGGSGGAQSGGPGTLERAAQSAGDGASTSGVSAGGASTSSSGAAAPVPAGTGSFGGVGSDAPTQALPVGAGVTRAAAPAFSGGSAGAAAGAAGGAESLAVAGEAVGVAETGTGVGAWVGVPTMLAAGTVAAAAKAVELSQAAGDLAVSDVDDPAAGQP